MLSLIGLLMMRLLNLSPHPPTHLPSQEGPVPLAHRHRRWVHHRTSTITATIRLAVFPYAATSLQVLGFRFPSLRYPHLEGQAQG